MVYIFLTLKEEKIQREISSSCIVTDERKSPIDEKMMMPMQPVMLIAPAPIAIVPHPMHLGGGSLSSASASSSTTQVATLLSAASSTPQTSRTATTWTEEFKQQQAIKTSTETTADYRTRKLFTDVISEKAVEDFENALKSKPKDTFDSKSDSEENPTVVSAKVQKYAEIFSSRATTAVDTDKMLKRVRGITPYKGSLLPSSL